MSKYSELFNKQSGGAAATTNASPSVTSQQSAPSSSPTDTSSSRDTTDTTAGNATHTAGSAAAPTSHRNRLVRRRRDGATGGISSNSSSSAAEPLATTPSAVSGSSDGATPAPIHATETESAVSSSPAIAEREICSAALPSLSSSTTTRDEVGANDEPVAAFDDSVDGGEDTDDLSESQRPATRLYTCDACMHYVCSSYADLAKHALEHHGDTLADYSRLRTVAEKLVPVWPQVRQRKAAMIQQWGRHVFAVAGQRDAGAEKMAEAHRARAQLEIVVQRWHPNARVFIFGSSVAFGVWDGMSDIDFTVVDVEELEAGLWPPSEKNAVRTITELLRRAGFSFINLEPISHARVPIIKHHASLPIRLTDEQRRRLHAEAARAAEATSLTPSTSKGTAEGSTTVTRSSSGSTDDDDTQLEAELVIARSVRYTLNFPASPLDSAVLEASIRHAVGSAAVQQVWWNRSREMCCMTFDTTTNAVRAATCPLHFASAGMRARVQPVHEECRPELYGMDFDLSFRAFGIRNSHLLRRYLLSHPCARPGALVLKDWSKSSGVNNSVNGYLTSYAINIMWIYYLVHHDVIPYVSPSADIPASLRGNVSGDPLYAAIVDPTWSDAELAAMQAQAGELLLGFFYYYAFEFDWEHHVVSLNKPGVTTKASLGWDVEDVPVTMGFGGLSDAGGGHGAVPGQDAASAAEAINGSSTSAVHGSGGNGAGSAVRRNRATTRYSFCIEDPYEENLNLGRHMGVTKTLRVQTEFYRGLLSLLKDDVHHCCVFAGSSAAEKSGVGQPRRHGTSVTGGAAEGSAAEPKELPLRVLYRLMAAATREMAIARAKHASGATKVDFPGVPLETFTAALAAQAPAEWKVATNAWNVQQLLHRLGLKVHGGVYVLPRREVGVRRLAAQVPPGVVFSTAPEPVAAASVPPAEGSVEDAPPSAESALTTAEIAAQNSRLLRGFGARHLSNDVLLAVARGYECLTPQWVAWSKPWAALSAWWTDRRQNPAPPPRASAIPEQAVGAMHQTRKQLTTCAPWQRVKEDLDTGRAGMLYDCSVWQERRGVCTTPKSTPPLTCASPPPASLRRALRLVFRK